MRMTVRTYLIGRITPDTWERLGWGVASALFSVAVTYAAWASQVVGMQRADKLTIAALAATMLVQHLGSNWMPKA